MTWAVLYLAGWAATSAKMSALCGARDERGRYRDDYARAAAWSFAALIWPLMLVTVLPYHLGRRGFRLAEERRERLAVAEREEARLLAEANAEVERELRVIGPRSTGPR